jgi:hypothetical protein
MNDMEIGIAVYEGEHTPHELHTPMYRKVRILSCSAPWLEGTKFLLDKSISPNTPMLVQFNPNDQFCKIVSLEDARNSIP